MRLPLTTEGSRKLRQLIRQQFAWPGGYEIFFVTSDGGVLCGACARSNYREIAAERRMKVSHGGWMILFADTTEDLSESCICDHCRRELCPIDHK